MRTTVTVVPPDGAVHQDVLVDVAASAPLGEVIELICRLVSAPSQTITSLDGRLVDPLKPIGVSPLREGAILTIGAGERPRPQAGLLELRVVGGPAAGSVYPLLIGQTAVGRAVGSAVRIDDPDVSREHAVVTVRADGATVSDEGSTNGTYLDGAPVGSDAVPLRQGTRMRVGDSTLVLAAPGEAPVALLGNADGSVSFNRPPRLDAPGVGAAPVTVQFPAEPAERAPARMPLIATIAPLIAGVALAVLMRRPEYLLFTALSPIMMAAQWASDRIGHRRSRRRERAGYEATLGAAQQKVAAALAVEIALRHHLAPDPALLSKIACAPSVRLWERRRDDADFLTVRLGLGELPADVAIAGGAPGTAATTVSDVPVTVDLGIVGVLGLAGPSIQTAAIARSVVGQLAVLRSPRDLRLILLTEPARAAAWEWVRWLPHLRPTGDQSCQALLGLDPGSVSARVSELAAMVDARQGATTRAVVRPGPTMVIVVDGSRALRATPALAHVLAYGPDVGVHAVCLDEDEAGLPEDCRAVAAVTGETSTRITLQLPGSPSPVLAIADGVSAEWAERISRSLAPLRDDTRGCGAGALPPAARWLEIVQCGDDITSELLERWRRDDSATTRAVIGVGTDGPFAVDLALDGPHALLAGTTGSGKSELLRTLVASLAVANRPDELSFVLVDYKGGAAFGACAALPHTVGVVTDLDGGLVERALVSLSAELKRRESLLAAVGAPSIEVFRRHGHGLGRLVIIVDEFASLAEEFPDFVGGLVGIAQRGRSLGVHLVLATQRPEGVVSADIRANANLRICLAVMRDSESRDVIDAPDAARISRTTPGRAYVRTGHGELRAFQSGRVGGDAQAATETTDVDVRPAPFRSLCLPDSTARPSAQGSRPIDPREATKTDLDRIVAACCEAAIRLDIEVPASPWMAPLPTVVTSSPSGPGATSVRPLRAVLGLHDMPARQTRADYVVDLATIGPLVVAGSARSGRTTTLRTLAALLAQSTPTRDLHLYAVDFGGGSLGALAQLPHCGAVISAHEPDRIRRLFSLLTDTLTERQHALAAGGFASLTEQRAQHPNAPPHIVLMIDGWDGFTTSVEDIDAGAVVDAATRLLHEGAGVGMHVVATADRAGLVGRLATTVDHRIVLRLADRSDFSLIGLPARSVPAVMSPGRGFLVDGLVETQISLLSADCSGAAQLAALSEIARAAQLRDLASPPAERPRHVDPLPVRIALSDIPRPSSDADHDAAAVVLGVGGNELDAVIVHLLDSGPGFLIAGPPRSGRSTAMATIGCGLRAVGWTVIAVASRPSILRENADCSFGVSADGFEATLADAPRPTAVLVDDAELLTDTPVAAALDRLMRGARDAGHVVAIAGTTDDLSVGFRGFIVDARRGRTGLLLMPRGPFDGEVLGVRLPRGRGADAGDAVIAGRGLLVVRGAVSPVQVALPT